MHLWLIRDAQLEALKQGRKRAFVDRAADWLRTEFPRECGELGDEKVRASVETALEKGETYRFSTSEEVYAYLELMYLLGFDFDQKSHTAWTKETLTDFDLGPRTRLLLLVEEARQRSSRKRRKGA